MTKIFHPLLALIASATDKELANYVENLKEEIRILRTRITGQVHTKPRERERQLKLGKAIGRAIEELITIVSPSTFYRWVAKSPIHHSLPCRTSFCGNRRPALPFKMTFIGPLAVRKPLRMLSDDLC